MAYFERSLIEVNEINRDEIREFIKTAKAFCFVSHEGSIRGWRRVSDNAMLIVSTEIRREDENVIYGIDQPTRNCTSDHGVRSTHVCVARPAIEMRECERIPDLPEYPDPPPSGGRWADFTGWENHRQYCQTVANRIAEDEADGA